MPDPRYYTLEVQHCPGQVLVGGELTVTLAPKGDDPSGEKWSVTPVFDPDRQIIGWTLVNGESGGALKYCGENEYVQIGSARAPVEADVVWNIAPHDDGPYFVISSVIDEEQCLDAPHKDTDCQGAKVECWGRNYGDHQMWRFVTVSTDPGTDQ